jgi:hypothetical protein
LSPRLRTFISVPAPTPTQASVARELFQFGAARPQFDAGLGPRLRGLLEAKLQPVAERHTTRDPLYLSKQVLTRVTTCEGWLLAERQARFAWSAAAARGTVAHKAVELALALPECPAPHDLVDLAIERLVDAGEPGIRSFLLDAPAAEVAELRAAAADWVVKFQDSFPALRRSWRPRVESSLGVELCEGRVVLRGKVDLALGRPDGTTGRVLIVDFKTGRIARHHADDLRFYAMLETLRTGVPPFRLATFCLDSGTWVAEDVRPSTLGWAVRRTVEAARRVEAVEGRRHPSLTPGPSCRWCPAAGTCPVALSPIRLIQPADRSGWPAARRAS